MKSKKDSRYIKWWWIFSPLWTRGFGSSKPICVHVLCMSMPHCGYVYTLQTNFKYKKKQTIIFSWDLFHANIFGKTDFSVTNQPVPSGKLTWLAGKWTCWRCILYLNMGIFRCEILAYRSVTSKSHRQPRSLHQQVPFEHIWYLIKHSPYQKFNPSYLVGPNHLIILVGKLVI